MVWLLGLAAGVAWGWVLPSFSGTRGEKYHVRGSLKITPCVWRLSIQLSGAVVLFPRLFWTEGGMKREIGKNEVGKFIKWDLFTENLTIVTTCPELDVMISRDLDTPSNAKTKMKWGKKKGISYSIHICNIGKYLSTETPPGPRRESEAVDDSRLG